LTRLAFAAEIPAVQNHRFDMIVVQDADTLQREGVVNFIDLFKVAMAPIVLKGNPKHVSPTNLCGLTAAGDPGSFEDTVDHQLSDACVAAGKPAINILEFDSGTSEVQSILTGRADFYLVIPPVASYLASQNPNLQVVRQAVPIQQGSASFSGWPVSKDLVFDKALVAAIKVLQKNGTWLKILKAHGADLSALFPPRLDGKLVP
jgi:polar amino acid transport system substrate-binding protein